MKQTSDISVLVTGGGSGIGLAIARGFLAQGSRVAITGRDEAKLLRASASLDGGDHLVAVSADVADPSSVKSLVQQVVARFGDIDVLVNNAGINIKDRATRQLTPEKWQQLLRANLDGAFYCIHEVLPGMLKQGRGLIINISSTAGKRAGPLGGSAYAASKFGLRALGICLAAEEESNGIRVSTIYPGEVNTPILEHRPQPISEGHRKKILQPEDVAAAVLFVANMPDHVSIPELVIKPTGQVYV